MNTTSGPRQDDFLSTRWSLVLRAQQADGSAKRDEALDELCRIYWAPVYSYVRRRGHSPQDSEDLAQDYFRSLLGRRYLDGADSEIGKLRQYILADLKLFLKGERAKRHAKKRGGGATHIPIGDVLGEWGEQVHDGPVDEVTPEELFDRRWAEALMNCVLDKLMDIYQRRGEGDGFQLLRPLVLGDDSVERYSELAVRLNCSEGALKVRVHRLRKRFRDLLMVEVGRTLDDPCEVDAELRYLASIST